MMFLVSHAVFCQKQLVVLKRGSVVAHFNPGDDFVFKKKGDSNKISTYVNNLSDTAVVTHRDTIPFRQIDRIYFTQHTFLQTIGTALTIAGAGYFLIDQINNVIVNGNRPKLDKDINRFSVPALAVGLPLIFIRKKSQRIGYKYRIMTVTKESPFYHSDTPKGYVSPYIPH